MAIKRAGSFKRRVVDHVTDELVNILSDGESYEFQALFAKTYAALKLKNAVSGGEEMLRLRCYEKLLSLASRGLVMKTGRNYLGLKGLEAATSVQTMARMDAQIAVVREAS